MSVTKNALARKCGSKVKYKTLEDAKQGAVMFANKRKIITILRPYDCSICGGFHFGRTKSIDWSKL